MDGDEKRRNGSDKKYWHDYRVRTWKGVLGGKKLLTENWELESVDGGDSVQRNTLMRRRLDRMFIIRAFGEWIDFSSVTEGAASMVGG